MYHSDGWKIIGLKCYVRNSMTTNGNIFTFQHKRALGNLILYKDITIYESLLYEENQRSLAWKMTRKIEVHRWHLIKNGDLSEL